MKRFVSYLCCAGCALALLVGPVAAIPPFFNEFKAKYADPDGEEPQKALAEQIEAMKQMQRCNICHEGKDKKKRNAYGEALAELLDKKEDKDNKEKIQESLDKVAEMKVDPEDDKSPTYGDLLKEGKFPVEIKEEE
jgi:hypothetical protein